MVDDKNTYPKRLRRGNHILYEYINGSALCYSALICLEDTNVRSIASLTTMALSGWLAHFCQARAFEEADTSAVMPFDFSRLIFGAILAWLIFDEIADKWVWTGALIIFAAGYVTTRLEAKKP